MANQYAINPYMAHQNYNQLSAVSGYKPSQAEEVRGMASVYPQILAAQKAQELADEQMRLEKSLAKQQERQANRATAMQAVQTGVFDTGLYKPIYNSYLKPLTNSYANAFTPSLVQTQGLPLASGVSTGATYGTAGFSSAPAVANAGMTSGMTGGTVPAAAQVGGIGMGGIATLGLANAIATTATGYGTGLAAKKNDLGNKWMGNIGSEDFRNVMTGGATGAVAGFLTSGLNPIGATAGLVSGALGGCIIVSACTNSNSYEVKITKEYRNRFMDKESIRGYYMIAEQIVPIIKKYEDIRTAFKTHLIDRLVDYAEMQLGYKETLNDISSRDIAVRFLDTCKKVGSTIPRYIRSNGEVV